MIFTLTVFFGLLYSVSEVFSQTMSVITPTDVIKSSGKKVTFKQEDSLRAFQADLLEVYCFRVNSDYDSALLLYTGKEVYAINGHARSAFKKVFVELGINKYIFKDLYDKNQNFYSQEKEKFGQMMIGSGLKSCN